MTYDGSSSGRLPGSLATRTSVAPALRTAVSVTFGACLLTIGAKVQVPGPVPATLQTLALMAVGSLSGSRLATASVATYLAAGLAGLPVFAIAAAHAAGPSYLLGPTGGYLLGMLPAAWLVGRAADTGLAKRVWTLLPVLVAASCVVFAVGVAWLATYASFGGGTGLGLSRSWQLGGAPFIAVESLKILIGSLLLPRMLSVARR